MVARLQRVCHVVDELDDEALAALQQWQEQCRPAGLPAEVVALRSRPQTLAAARAAGLAVVPLTQRWTLDPWVRWGLYRRLRGPGVLCHPWGTQALHVVCRNAASHHCTLAPVLQGRPPRDRRQQARCRAWFRRAQAIVAPDPAATAWFADLLPATTPQWVVPTRPAAAPSLTADQLAQLRRSWGVPGPLQWIVVGGPLLRRRRLDGAIWALTLLRVVNPHLRLVIAGQGPDQPRLERFARQVGEAHAVRFEADPRAARRWLASAAAYWEFLGAGAPSSWMYEALASGKAVCCVGMPFDLKVVSHLSSVVRLAHDDRAGLTRRTLAFLERPTSAACPDADPRLLGEDVAGSTVPQRSWLAMYAALGLEGISPD